MDLQEKIDRISDRCASDISSYINEVPLNRRYLESYIVEAIYNAMDKKDYEKLQQTHKDTIKEDNRIR